MESVLYNQEGQNVGKLEIPSSVFGCTVNADLLYQVVNSQLANTRKNIANTKGRGEVRGGGKKPWRQKGTGRARHGSIRSPIWKGGGVTFGPTSEKIYSKKINRKMASKALKVALSSKFKDGELVFVDSINLADFKTKNISKVYSDISKIFGPKKSKTLIITSDYNKNLIIGSKNIKDLRVMEAKELNALTALSFKNLVLIKDSIKSISDK